PGTGLEQCGLRISRYVRGGFEHAEGPRALRMRLALGHLLAVEMRHLLEEMHVVQHDRPVGADGERVAVAGRRGSGAHRRAGRVLAVLVCHGDSLRCEDGVDAAPAPVKVLYAPWGADAAAPTAPRRSD